VRISTEELHRAGGVPPGWRFSWPAGDPRKGREVFVKLECYQCHEVKGESFPPVVQDPARRGPALSGAGDQHPVEYFAESILDPNAVIVTGPGHTGPDGLSIMPDFRDSLTLAETIDLVAYLRSLAGGGGHDHHAHHAAGPESRREQVEGPYRIRLAYTGPGQPGPHEHGPGHADQAGQPGPKGHPHPPGRAAGASTGHLMVFVTDVARGELLPYLPVTATIHGVKPPRSVRLAPMLSDQGFHYGADVALPAGVTKITVAIGKPTLRLAPGEATGFTGGAEVSFEWGK
jgi:hypothetical protein